MNIEEALGLIDQAPAGTLKNESPGETGPALPSSRFEKIREMGDGLFRKFGLKRGRGRPRNCPTCALPETQCPGHVGLDADGSPAMVPPGPAGNPPEPAIPRDPLLIKRSIAAIARALRKWADKTVYSKAILATDGDKAFAAEIRDQTSASDDACDAAGEITDIVLKEMGLDSKYLPLAAAVVVVVGAVGPYVVVIKSLNKQIAARHRGQAPEAFRKAA